MATNELWNVDSLEIASTIAAANAPSPSTATLLSTEIAALEATRVTKAVEFDKFQSIHKELKKEAKETNERLAKDLVTLQELGAQTNTLVEATLRKKEVIARIAERIDTLVGKAAPLHIEIEEIEAQLIEKDTKAKKSKRSRSQGNSPLKNPTRMPPISQQSLHKGNEGILRIL
jgi:chromosome segregation ATPase